MEETIDYTTLSNKELAIAEIEELKKALTITQEKIKDLPDSMPYSEIVDMTDALMDTAYETINLDIIQEHQARQKGE